jgi:hypothetical protein
MLQRFKVKGFPEHVTLHQRSFHLLQDVGLDRVCQVLRYLGIALLSIAYLVVTVICVLQKHPMSSYLMMPLCIVFLIAAVAILSQIKKIKNNN